jgi:hypothetical protein
MALDINHRMETSKQRRALRALLTDQFPVGKYPAAVVFTDPERRAVLDLYREDNERLFVDWMPEFPKDSYATVAATRALAAALPVITG